MYYYKRTITSGDMVEIEVYKSVRKRNKKNVGRSVNVNLTPEKQKAANELRAIKSARRIIANNFIPGDMWLRYSFRDDMSEEEADKLVNNYLRRVKYYRQKHGLSELKFYGVLECGKRGKRWHFHVVMNKMSFEVIEKLWGYGWVALKSLYSDGQYKDLAKYLRKDEVGKRKIKRSRNLEEPKEKVVELGKKKIKEIESGVVPEIPEGYYLAEAEHTYNDLTGTSFTFTLLPIAYMALSRAAKKTE